ncbi:hypothetical protein IW261DRAFT_1611415 [Armillaria novae-zelandiae]|uniref:Uncharacterized protein n=1 Tax=Armillaria novae-zelandiae TaxID=153914 RepID=A0AA39NVP6_9AGAR|nr:hypothetical protein IW261DRAFT_1611415 [Armillaria novae-zelandiae]
MATQTDIPSDLTDSDKAQMFQFLDIQLNSTILYTLLHGVYTGILAVTLWNIFINKCWPIQRATVFSVMIILYALITISFAANWSSIYSAFIENGTSFWTVTSKLTSVGQAAALEAGITASISTVLTDLYMIWCCWTVWGQRWFVVIFPILSLISATVSKIIDVYHEYFNAPAGVFPTLYISFVLATTLFCTLLIIIRILTKYWWNSSALYSISLILYLAFTICVNWGGAYFDAIAAIAKGIAPTLIVGRVAAGHTRPKDDCDEITVSTLRFQEATMQSAVFEADIEAQRPTWSGWRHLLK